MSFFSIKKNKIVFVALAAFIILRIPSLYEPHWYADEGIYAAITYGIENGKQLYVNLWDNKPLLIYWIYGLGNSTNRLLIIRLLNLLAGGTSLVGIYILLNYMKLRKRYIAFAMGLGVILLGTPLLEGNIANAENFFIPLTIFGYVVLLKKRPLYALSGLLFGIGFLLKFHPIFDFAAALLFLLFSGHKKRHIVLFASFFMLPSLLQYAYLYVNGNLVAAIQTLYFNNYGYTQSFSSGVRSLPFKTAVLGIAIIVLAFRYLQDNISSKKLLLSLMLIFQAYGVLFGGRQYLHYMIQIIPGAVIVTGLMLQKLEKRSLWGRMWLLTVSLSVLVIFMKLFYYGGGTAFHLKIVPYYSDFYSFASGKQPYFLYPIDETLQSMKFELEQYRTKNIFIYSNNPWIYDVLEIVPPTKIVAGYHRTFIAEGEFFESLLLAKPEIMVIDIQADPYDRLDEYLLSQFTYKHQVDNYEIWVRN